MQSTKILLVDDHEIFRQGVRSLLSREPNMEVIGEAGDGRNALEMAQALRPDVVIMDISMPDLNGIDATRQLVAEMPGIFVIALTAHSDTRMMAETLAAGAAGFMLKASAVKELITAIRTVRDGKIYLAPALSDIAAAGGLVGKSNGVAGAFRSLTAREREVLQLIAEGKATKQVAACLHVSVKTVETHRRQIMAKLNLDSVAQLTKYAVREGLTSLEH